MTFRFAIVGAGLTGTSMLYQLVRRLACSAKSGMVDPRRVHIHVFDKQPVASPGFPHNERFVQPHHITNMCAEEMGVLYSRQRDFSDWVESRRLDLETRFPAFRAFLCDPMYHQDTCSHYPRALMGEYLKARFADALKIAETLGIKVEIHTDTEVSGLTACRMQISSASFGKHTPTPLQKPALTLRLPGTTSLRVALPSR